MNDKFIQIHGPFQAEEELMDKIKDYDSDFFYIKKLGIQTEPKHICCINNIDFEIGKTGILEFDNVNILSIYFKQEEPLTTLIDCITG